MEEWPLFIDIISELKKKKTVVNLHRPHGIHVQCCLFYSILFPATQVFPSSHDHLHLLFPVFEPLLISFCLTEHWEMTSASQRLFLIICRSSSSRSNWTRWGGENERVSSNTLCRDVEMSRRWDIETYNHFLSWSFLILMSISTKGTLGKMILITHDKM